MLQGIFWLLCAVVEALNDIRGGNEATHGGRTETVARQAEECQPMTPPRESDIKIPRAVGDADAYRLGYEAGAERESEFPSVERAAAYEALLITVKQAYDTPSWLGEAIDAVMARFG